MDGNILWIQNISVNGKEIRDFGASDKYLTILDNLNVCRQEQKHFP